MLPWNCRTAIALTMFINLARQYAPWLSIPTNIMNPAAWIHSGRGLFGIDVLSWPVQVQFVNPLFDQSRFTIMSSRWSDMHTVSAPLLEDAGCQIRAYTWLLEDETSPHPELTTNMGGMPGMLGKAFGALDKLSRPHRNCVVMAIEDRSGTTGPTGTFADGPIKLATKTADDLITETVVPLLPGDIGRREIYDPSNVVPFFQKLTMTAPEPPWVVWRDGEYSGIVESQRSMHGSTAKTIMTGGKSPGWVNATQTFLIKYALSQLSMCISMPGTAAEEPGSPGLEEIYQGYLDDTLLAYQRFTDPIRAIRMGDLAFLEHWEAGSGSAYTVSGLLSLRTGHWKTRAYTSFQTTVRNNAPFAYAYDFDLGDRVGFQMANIIHVDQLTAVRRSYDESTAMKLELSIGRDVEEEDPVARATRTLAQLWNLVGVFFGSQDLF